MTRRELARFLAGLAAAGTMRGEEPILSVSGVDHIKVRVANAGASAMFYYGLFGGDAVPVRNSTFPDSPEVDEVFLKIGGPSFPFPILSDIRKGESPGLDHVSILTGDVTAALARLARNGIALAGPKPSVWFQDTDGTPIEMMAGPTWGLQMPSMRLPVPSNLRSLRPAFEAAALARIHLRVADMGRAVSFYSQLFGRDKVTGEGRFACGPTVLQLSPGAGVNASGLDRLAISIRDFKPEQARRILEERGIKPIGSQHQVLLRDLDGNGVELIAV